MLTYTLIGFEKAMIPKELNLESVGEALPGVSASGSMAGGETFMLGNCELEDATSPLSNEEGDESPQQSLFMAELTASALPVASPAAAGLLSVAFLNCFAGGVEFVWSPDDVMNSAPSVTFYGDNEGKHEDSYSHRVNIEVLEGTGLPSVLLSLNGEIIPALLDTGSPITVINDAAASKAGISSVKEVYDVDKDSDNFFSKFTEGFKKMQSTVSATQKGDLLLVGGAQGERVELWKSNDSVKIEVGEAAFSKSPIYIGDIPGLSVLGGLGASSPPAAILGMDVLRTRPRMLYRSQEVYF